MTIEIDEDILAIWYVKLTPISDWLCSAKRNASGGVDVLYRFRYYHSPDPWDQQDVRRWYQFKTNSPPEEALQKLGDTATLLAEKSGGQRWELLRGTASLAEFMKAFEDLPFTHSRIEVAPP